MSKKSAVPDVAIRVLKIDTCSTLSGRSQLTYHVGCDANGDIRFKVVANSGSGQFNAEWVSLSVIEKLLSAHPADKPMTSRVMLPVFRSKSSNSPAFLFAVLMAEGLVKAGSEKDSGYLLGDIDGFKQAMATLIATGTDISEPANAAPAPSKKKRPAKESE